eukprot:m.697524 g.697524  ORF g.697524 m.697524 type:complete len:53 (+) comp58681_c0_seq7:4172-4330(+)
MPVGRRLGLFWVVFFSFWVFDFLDCFKPGLGVSCEIRAALAKRVGLVVHALG